MGNYANQSLEERIERRRKRRRAARRRKIILFLIVLALLAGIVCGAISIFSGGNDTPAEKQPVTQEMPATPENPETPDVPATPETPETPEAPENPDTPVVPETPVNPEMPDATEPTGEGGVPLGASAVNATNAIETFLCGGVNATVTELYSAVNAKLLNKNVDPDKPMVALTFDDGPSKKYGGRIMDALEKVNGRATYFVVGNLIDGKSDLLQRAISLGCEVENHSYDHPHTYKILSDDQVREQITKTNELIEKATGVAPKYVRTPGGWVNASVKSIANAPIINWSLDTRDWESRNADAIVKIVLDNVKDGDIILMHEIYPASADAAEIIIPELVKRGYQLVTVSELFEARGITPQKGKVYFEVPPKK